MRLWAGILVCVLSVACAPLHHAHEMGPAIYSGKPEVRSFERAEYGGYRSYDGCNWTHCDKYGNCMTTLLGCWTNPLRIDGDDGE